MIYTIGHIESYEQYFKEQGIPKKKGRTKDYPGGSVWRTAKEAQNNCPVDYSVYGILADWEIDTVPNKTETYNDLLYDKELVRIIS